MVGRLHDFSLTTQPHPEEDCTAVRLEGRGVSRAPWTLLRDAADAAPQDEARGPIDRGEREGGAQ